jgi:hypothetical protein
MVDVVDWLLLLLFDRWFLVLLFDRWFLGLGLGLGLGGFWFGLVDWVSE